MSAYLSIEEANEAFDKIIDYYRKQTEEKANKAHVIYELILKGTYDEQIYELLEERASAVDAINNFKKYMKGD